MFDVELYFSPEVCCIECFASEHAHGSIVPFQEAEVYKFVAERVRIIYSYCSDARLIRHKVECCFQ